MYEFRWPTRTLVGRGLIERVDEYVTPSATAWRLLLVAPREEWAQPLVQRIAKRLREATWERVETFAEVQPNPSWETVARGAERGKVVGASAVLAGGSTWTRARSSPSGAAPPSLYRTDHGRHRR